MSKKQNTEENQEEVAENVECGLSPSPQERAVQKYSISNLGLVAGVDYIFNEDGSIDWRKMIKNDFLYPNKGWFDIRKKAAPTNIDGLQDNQLLIMLGGIKELAKTRGFSKVSYQVTHISSDYVVAKCSIVWRGNYETNYESVTYEDVANATADNTDDFCRKFLETIACNRAFVRCVRNFLNIHIVGADEIDKSKNSSGFVAENDSYDTSIIPITPSAILEKTLRDKKSIYDFDAFKSLLRDLWSSETYRNDGVANWNSFSDIPAKEARILLTIINKQ